MCMYECNAYKGSGGFKSIEITIEIKLNLGDEYR